MGETKKLFNSIVPFDVVDFSSISRTAMHGIFLTGLAPRACPAALTPNCLASVRVLYLGEIACILIPMAKLVEVAKAEIAAAGNKLTDFLSNLTEDKLNGLLEKDVPMYTCVQGPGTALFVPMGFVVIEKVTAGQLVVHVRISCAFAGQPGVANAKAAAAFLPAKEQKRLGDILDLCA